MAGTVKKLLPIFVLLIICTCVCIILFACSKTETIVITLDTLDGNKPTTIEVEKGKPFSIDSIPQRLHYEFISWYKDDSLSSVFVTDKDVFDSDTTLYACWLGEKLSVTVTSDNEEQLFSFRYGDIVTTNLLTRNGYSLVDCSTLSGAVVEFPFTILENMYLRAEWQQLDYTASFETSDESITEQILHYGDILTLPTPKPIAKKVFKGWYTLSNSSYYYLGSYTITGNVKFYALWEDANVKAMSIEAGSGLKSSYVLLEDIDWSKIYFTYVYDDGLDTVGNIAAYDGSDYTVDINALNLRQVGDYVATFTSWINTSLTCVFEYTVLSFYDALPVKELRFNDTGIVIDLAEEDILTVLTDGSVEFYIYFDSEPVEVIKAGTNNKAFELLEYTDVIGSNTAKYRYTDAFDNIFEVAITFTVINGGE